MQAIAEVIWGNTFWNYFGLPCLCINKAEPQTASRWRSFGSSMLFSLSFSSLKWTLGEKTGHSQNSSVAPWHLQNKVPFTWSGLPSFNWNRCRSLAHIWTTASKLHTFIKLESCDPAELQSQTSWISAWKHLDTSLHYHWYRTRRWRKIQKYETHRETYRRGCLLWVTDGRAKTLMDRQVIQVSSPSLSFLPFLWRQNLPIYLSIKLSI